MIFAFDCIFYYVHDLERAITFYTQVLGLEFESRDVVARLRLDGVLVELVPAPQQTTINGTGNARLCLRVTDIYEARAELRKKGALVGDARLVENGIVCPFFDPDGNELALWQST